MNPVVQTITTIIGIAVLLFGGFWIAVRPLLAIGHTSRHLRRTQVTAPKKLDIDGISVVVPCHNESASIAEVAQSILASNVNCPMQLVLVENNSTDNTYEIISRLAAEDPRILALSKPTPKGLNPISYSINYGIKHAKYERIVRMDADTIVDRNSIRELVLAASRPGVSTAASNVRVSNPDENLITKMQTVDYLFAMEMERKSQMAYNSVLCCSGAFQTFRKSDVLSVGGYLEHKEIGEDLELTIKMHQKGDVPFAPAAVCYTDVPNNVKTLYKQRLWWHRIGLVTAYIHRDKMLHSQANKKSTLGYLGLPTLVFDSLYWIGATIVGVAFTISSLGYFALGHAVAVMLLTYLIFFGFTAVAFFYAGFRAENRQGLNNWWLLPMHYFIYENMMIVVKVVGTYQAAREIKKLRAAEAAANPALAPITGRIPLFLSGIRSEEIAAIA